VRRLLVQEPRDARNITLLLIAMVLAAALEALGVGAVMPFIALLQDDKLVETSTGLRWLRSVSGATSHMSLVAVAGIVLVGMFVVKNAYLAVVQYAQNRFIFGRQAALSRRIFSQYLHSPYVFHLRTNTAQLISTLDYDVAQMINHVGVNSAVVAVEAMTMAVVACVLVWVEPVAVPLVGAVLGASAFLFYRYIHRNSLKMGEREHLNLREGLKWLQQGLGGIKETQVAGREGFFLDAYANQIAEYCVSQRKHRTIALLPRYLLETLGVIGLVSVCLVMLWRGNTANVLPTLGVVAIAAVRLLPSVARILGALTDLRHHLPSLQTLDSALTEGRSSAGIGAPVALPLARELEFRNVGFAYPEAPDAALKDVSFTLKRGESIALVGPSGGGKTTLVDVLIGLLPPGRGEVLVDGESIAGPMVGRWRRSVGYIPQHVYLSDDTVARNVAWGLADSEIDRDRVRRCLELASLGSWVASLKEGIDTIVGERGARLSGGERQRVGIARALYTDPQLLVLDEATSSLDSRTERDIVASIETLRKNRTMVVVAHRLSTVRGCDRLFFVRAGRVIQMGTWAELYDSNDEFRQLVQMSLRTEGHEYAAHSSAAG
jgi:ATP-binding cassette subfamily C protein